MIRIDTRPVPQTTGEIRLFSVMRNESFRLQSWLAHHRRIGVDRFFVVDNASTDPTIEILLDQPDVHVYRSDEDFQTSQSGRVWLEQLMTTHGVGFWCVVADADEYLAFPHWETVSIRRLTETMQAEGHDVLRCVLLDMYASGPVCDAHGTERMNPFEICPWFDPDFVPFDGAVDHGDDRLAIPTFVGSTRKKVFGVDAYLSKVGLLRFRPDMLLTRGQHGVFGGRPTDVRGVMFHFKFFSNFPGEVARVVLNGERANCSAEWRAYANAFAINPRLSLHDHRSVRLVDSEQLVEIGVLKTTAAFERCIHGERL